MLMMFNYTTPLNLPITHQHKYLSVQRGTSTKKVEMNKLHRILFVVNFARQQFLSTSLKIERRLKAVKFLNNSSRFGFYRYIRCSKLKIPEVNTVLNLTKL